MSKVIKGDSLEVLEAIENNSIDLIIADPPYNLSHGNKMEWEEKNWDKVKEDWDEFTIDDYMSFTRKWISKAKEVLTEGGNIFIFGTYHNIGDVNVCLKKLNMDILNEIIWYKRNAFPNLSQTRLTASHETILWAYKGSNKNYTFNYDWLKKYCWNKCNFDKKDTQVRSVWNIPTNSEESYNHPTQKPMSVIERIVLGWSNEGDTVLDPFLGSGTTAVASKKNKRDFIGIEREQEYVDMARERLEEVKITESQGEDSVFNY